MREDGQCAVPMKQLTDKSQPEKPGGTGKSDVNR